MRRRTRKLNTQGMTLIEIMIVVVIMALIAAGVGLSVMRAGEDAKHKLAATGAKNLVTVAEAYALQYGPKQCPSVDDLQAARLMRSGAEPNDPWGSPYRIECGDEVNVRSAGPDGQLGNADDIAAF